MEYAKLEGFNASARLATNTASCLMVKYATAGYGICKGAALATTNRALSPFSAH
jgi:hypothetical protein